jgi:amino acid transporter
MQKAEAANQPNKTKSAGLGTFGGVFTPSILTILGVIMYLRFGWVVGNVGLYGTFVIVTLATLITLLTGLSISAIATDQRVRTGGAYYMISRSLGIESGGAIGIPLYLALALSIALYTVGFAESVTAVFPQFNLHWVGIITTVLIGGLALTSAKTVIKTQYFIMAGIGLSLISLVLGSPLEGMSHEAVELQQNVPVDKASFWRVFAVFFPAVTGIMAGVNMSGDLKNPGKSIPRGTLAAIACGYFIYMILPFILINRADHISLLNDPLIMRRISLWGDAILIGVWGATLSSALGSVLGAPRVLQALARDGVLPRWLSWLGKGFGKEDDPRVGTIFTIVIVLFAVALGNLNIIAPILTMFFLTTYGVLNITAGVEQLLGSPSYRPKFKVHWSLSILGALGCLLVMFLINPLATVIAFVFIAVIFIWLERRELKAAFGGVKNGIWMSIVRAGLLRLSDEEQVKTWRPHPLVFSGAPTKRWHLIELASDITRNSGLMTVSVIVTSGDFSNTRLRQTENNIKKYFNKNGVRGLVRAIQAKTPFEGARMLSAAYGIGPMVPNTIIMGNNENAETLPEYCQLIHAFHQQNRNVLLLFPPVEGRPYGKREKIDIWWGGLKGNGGLMIILAYLIQSNPLWWKAVVTIKMIVKNEKARTGAHDNLKRIIESLRLNFQFEVIVKEEKPVQEIINVSSAGADLVFLGMARPDVPEQGFEAYFRQFQQRVKGMPTLVVALAAPDMSFGGVLMREEEWQFMHV